MRGERTVLSSMRRLEEWFADVTVEQIDRPLCQKYARERAALGRRPSTILTELSILSAALNEAEAAKIIRRAPKVWRPKPSPRRERWLTRDEAAKIIRACRRRGYTHVLRLFLLAIYTGTRKARILALRWDPGTETGWIDAENGVLYRRALGEEETSKRAPTVRLSNKMLRHARAWKKDGAEFVIHRNGKRMTDPRGAWAIVLEEAGIEGFVMHGTRHTAITWALQKGADTHGASGYFGVSGVVMEKVYAHHHPDHMKGVTDAIDK